MHPCVAVAPVRAGVNCDARVQLGARPTYPFCQSPIRLPSLSVKYAV
jgi:hypothetical protein